MTLNPFAKYDVVVESDDATPGTPFRTTTFRVYGRDCRRECIQKVRAALQMMKPGCEVLDLPQPAGRDAHKMGLRFRLSYHGEQIAADRIKATVAAAL